MHKVCIFSIYEKFNLCFWGDDNIRQTLSQWKLRPCNMATLQIWTTNQMG